MSTFNVYNDVYRELFSSVLGNLSLYNRKHESDQNPEPAQSKLFPKGELWGKGSVEPHLLTVLTLERDYPSETGYPWDNSRQTDNTS